MSGRNPAPWPSRRNPNPGLGSLPRREATPLETHILATLQKGARQHCELCMSAFAARVAGSEASRQVDRACQRLKKAGLVAFDRKAGWYLPAPSDPGAVKP